MEKTVKEYTLTLSSSPENVSEIEPFIEELKERFDIGDEVYGNILICLTEAVNNAILHGNEADETKKVKIACRHDDSSAVFTVKDEGSGFDYNNLPDPTDPNNLHSITGRGVFLMKQLSDTTVFSDGGSTVEMRFKL